MKPVYTHIKLGNPILKGTGEVKVRALVDESLPWLRLPALLVAEMGLEAYGHRWLTTGEAVVQKCRYVGPLMVRFGNRMGFCGAVEFGDTVRLGYLATTDLELTCVNGVLQAKPSSSWQPADEAGASQTSAFPSGAWERGK